MQLHIDQKRNERCNFIAESVFISHLPPCHREEWHQEASTLMQNCLFLYFHLIFVSVYVNISFKVVVWFPFIIYNVYTFLIPQLLDGGKAQTSRICSLLISVEWIPWPVDSVMLPRL